MNALHLAPLSVASTPPGPIGKPPTGEALSHASHHSSSVNPAAPGAKPAPRSHEAQQQRLAEARANTAREAAERKEQAEATPPSQDAAPVDTFDRKVGLVDGTFKVFVDLVKPPEGEAVFRVFGPPEEPAPEPAPEPEPRATTAAANAYARAGATLPLKDLGVA